jgi:MFS family permease
MYYAVFLFQQAGVGGTQASLLANGIEGVVLNVFTWVNMWYIDTWGRRKPMIIGAIGMAISMMLIGVIMKTEGMLLLQSKTIYLL